ncbi:MAG: hypothetical protein H8E37_01860 [Planctomycetes bacterium]|nr:hypothetical protein [Planctomycetota bacterium]
MLKVISLLAIFLFVVEVIAVDPCAAFVLLRDLHLDFANGRRSFVGLGTEIALSADDEVHLRLLEVAPLEEGIVTWNSIVEMADVLAGTTRGRESMTRSPSSNPLTSPWKMSRWRPNF